LPFLALLGPALKTGLDAAWSFASSRIGQLLIAFGVAWIWSGHRAHVACEQERAAFRASLEHAHQVELAREANAARDITTAATRRIEDDAAPLNRQTSEIEKLRNMEIFSVQPINIVAPHVAPDPRFLDPDFIGVVREFDAAGDRTAETPKRTAAVRRAGRAARPECKAVKLFALKNRAAAHEANRRLRRDKKWQEDVWREFSAKE
jgi:hypothetical protein